MEILYARDLDGTGSMHVCAADDPGAVAFVAIDEQTRSALMEAIDHFKESAEEWDASNSPEAERGAAQDRWNAELLSRLASK